jgi:hypothetical protein
VVNRYISWMTGVHLLEWVRAHYPKTVRLLMTGFAELDDPEMTVLLYGSDYWKEIINFEALVKYDMISPEDLSLFQFADDPPTAFELLKTGLAEYALQHDSPELPAVSKSVNPQKPEGA